MDRCTESYSDERAVYRQEQGPQPGLAVYAHAAQTGDLGKLKWARAQDPPYDWDARICSIAAEKGNLEVLQWLIAQDILHGIGM